MDLSLVLVNIFRLIKKQINIELRFISIIKTLKIIKFANFN
jgi:hypothetical protein